MLPRMAWFFIFCMCSKVMMPRLPVEVMTMSARSIASSTVTTSKLSMSACSVDRVDLGDLHARALPGERPAQPLPTSP